MTEDIVESLAELGLQTLQEWKEELLQVLRKGEITQASTGGGVQYARQRGMSVPSLLAAVNQAMKRIIEPDAPQYVGQCARVVFTNTIS